MTLAIEILLTVWIASTWLLIKVLTNGSGGRDMTPEQRQRLEQFLARRLGPYMLDTEIAELLYDLDYYLPRELEEAS